MTAFASYHILSPLSCRLFSRPGSLCRGGQWRFTCSSSRIVCRGLGTIYDPGPRYPLSVRRIHRPPDRRPYLFGSCFPLCGLVLPHVIDHGPSSMVHLRLPCHCYPSALPLMTFAWSYIVPGASYPRIAPNACPGRVRGTIALATSLVSLLFTILHDASRRTMYIDTNVVHGLLPPVLQ